MEDFTNDDGDDRLSEEDAFEMALDDHPDLKRMFLDDKLPDEMKDANGNVWSPMSHLALHAALECQIANDEPLGMREAANKLERSGIDHHEIRHLFGEALAHEVWESAQHDSDIDESRYMKHVREIVRDVTTDGQR